MEPKHFSRYKIQYREKTLDLGQLIEMRVLINDKIKQMLNNTPNIFVTQPSEIFSDMYSYYNEQKQTMISSNITIPKENATT
mgnify:CR=1 FL=1